MNCDICNENKPCDPHAYRIAELLNNHGVTTFRELSTVSPDQIRQILAGEGGIVAASDPSTWPDQAQLAAAGEWDKLKEWQDELLQGILDKS